MEGKSVKGVISAPDESTQEIGQKILSHGGNAVDAMTAMILNESVVLPSRVSLAGGGVCQVFDLRSKEKQTLDFLPLQEFLTKTSLPMLPRGVFAMHSDYGIKPWSKVVQPALINAQKGSKVSELLQKDIDDISDLDAHFMKLIKDDMLIQPNLAKTLKMISQSGTGVFYQGGWANTMSIAASKKGGNFTQEKLKAVRPKWKNSVVISDGQGKTVFSNTAVNKQIMEGWEKVLKNVDEGLNELSKNKSEQSFEGIGLMAIDKNGLIVSCAVGMGTLFGDGRYLEKQGFFIADGVATDQQYDIENIIHLNADETDILAVIVGTGKNSAIDGQQVILNTFFKQKDTPFSYLKNQQNNATSVLVCKKGYLNHADTCKMNALVQGIYKNP